MKLNNGRYIGGWDYKIMQVINANYCRRPNRHQENAQSWMKFESIIKSSRNFPQIVREMRLRNLWADLPEYQN